MNQQPHNLDKQLLDNLYKPVPAEVADQIAATRAQEQGIRQGLLDEITKQTDSIGSATTEGLYHLKMLVEVYDILVRCRE